MLNWIKNFFSAIAPSGVTSTTKYSIQEDMNGVFFVYYHTYLERNVVGRAHSMLKAEELINNHRRGHTMKIIKTYTE